MAAGLGFKTFTTGEVLTAADTNGYLMQGILVFASAAARDAAITSPQEGQACYLKDTDAVLTYSGTAWVGFDDSNAIQNSIVDAKGDIVAASGNDTPARLAVGNNGETLVADSSTATGLKWGGGWTTFTPSITGVTVGNGTTTARYAQIGKTVFVEFNFTLGSTSAITGVPSFALPVSASLLGYTFVGTGTLGDFGTASYLGNVNLQPGNRAYFSATSTSGATGLELNISSTVPFTWTTSDYLTARFTYEAA